MEVSTATSLIPQFQAPAETRGNTPKQDGGKAGTDGFSNILATLAALPKSSKQAPARTPEAPPKDQSGKQLEALLSSIAGVKVDLKAPNLGLTKTQLDQLAAALEKLLDESQSGNDLLMSLLAAGQASALLQVTDNTPLAALLSTSA